MKMRPADKDLIAGIVLLIFNIFIYTQITHIRWGHARFVYSAIFMPMSANVLFSILTAALIIKSIIKGGRLRFREWGAILKASASTREFRVVSIFTLVIFLLVFVAVPTVGFWISGSIFMLGVLLVCVKSFTPLLSVIFTVATIGVLYGIFVMIFMVPIR